MDIVKVYPSGRVTASVLRKFSVESVPSAYELSIDQQFNLSLIRLEGIKRALDIVASIGASESGSLAASPLGLSNAANLRKRAPRGRNGITSRGRNLVKSACAILEREYDRRCLSFLTVTLPSDVVHSAAEVWEKVVRNFRNKIVYHLQRHSLPPHFLAVTEVQEERYRKRGEVALHLHCVFVGRKDRNAGWEFPPETLTQLWKETVLNTVGSSDSSGSWRASVNVQQVKKSLVGYLGKYLSKGSVIVRDIIQNGHSDKLPSAWYCCTRMLLHKVAKSTVVITGSAAVAVFDFLRGDSAEFLCYQRFIEIEIQNGKRFAVGWIGQLKPGITEVTLFGKDRNQMHQSMQQR